jgi:hypothetical protein
MDRTDVVTDVRQRHAIMKWLLLQPPAPCMTAISINRRLNAERRWTYFNCPYTAWTVLELNQEQ